MINYTSIDNGTAMTSAAILTKYEGIPSKQSDLLGFKAYVMLNTYAGNEGSKNMEFGNRLLGNLRKRNSSWSAYVCAIFLPTLAK